MRWIAASCSCGDAAHLRLAGKTSPASTSSGNRIHHNWGIDNLRYAKNEPQQVGKRQLQHTGNSFHAIGTRRFWKGLYPHSRPGYRGRTRDATLTRAGWLKMLFFQSPSISPSTIMIYVKCNANVIYKGTTIQLLSSINSLVSALTDGAGLFCRPKSSVMVALLAPHAIIAQPKCARRVGKCTADTFHQTHR
jgi:hypothetical protein